MSSDASRTSSTPFLEDAFPHTTISSSLPYTRMVIEEALRLYPPAWGFSRQAMGPDEIGGYHLPRGWLVFIIPFVMHRHRAYWDEPESFDPERFTPERSAARPKFVYLPFGAGPRQCIGNQFAMIEAHLVLATLAHRYRLDAGAWTSCGAVATDHAATATWHQDAGRSVARLSVP